MDLKRHGCENKTGQKEKMEEQVNDGNLILFIDSSLNESLTEK